jgi:hypothetical protein
VTLDQTETAEASFAVEQLSWRQWMIELVTAIAITLGLAILWACEGARNAYFRLLDRLDFRPRIKRASAFPPGRPRKLRHR